MSQRVLRYGASVRFLLGVLRSFPHAFRGLREAFASERNLAVHGVAAAVAGGLALALRLPAVEVALLVLACAVVIALELVNTAIERAVDLVTRERHPLARAAKDTAAAAVLVAALGAVVIGLLLLGPPLWRTIALWVH